MELRGTYIASRGARRATAPSRSPKTGRGSGDFEKLAATKRRTPPKSPPAGPRVHSGRALYAVALVVRAARVARYVLMSSLSQPAIS